MLVPPSWLALPHPARREALARAARAANHLAVGDHVSFFVGAGFDGLTQATAILATDPAVPVHIAVYQLPLRHPVTVARSIATIGELAPGRLTLGVGVGGEDRHEIEICGVDPATRGARTDESLTILRRLLSGERVTFAGDHYVLDDALIVPAPAPAVPIIVGGRSDAAVSRAARLGDGWLGIWISPARFAAVADTIAAHASEAGRQVGGWKHELNVWCAFGDRTADARAVLATAMEAFYATPFERFERYAPHGSPESVAAALAPYVEAGCRSFNLIAANDDRGRAIDGVAAVRELLDGAVPTTASTRSPPATLTPQPAGATT
jgi:alkanesulfonate monooxygenase SsuD/methylene tetrahydromethanopterin reductase-like flavin-dependent oxidoreductase (luciferase family)